MFSSAFAIVGTGAHTVGFDAGIEEDGFRSLRLYSDNGGAVRTVEDAGPYNAFSEAREGKSGCGNPLPLPMGEVARRQARRRGPVYARKFCKCAVEWECGPSGTPVPTMHFVGAEEGLGAVQFIICNS